MAQRDWKSIALLSVGFSVGVAYTIACGDKNPIDAHAGENDSGTTYTNGETAPPGATAAGRSVVEIAYTPDAESLQCDISSSAFYDAYGLFDISAIEAACCPLGFTFIGWGPSYDSSNAAVCLEDA